MEHELAYISGFEAMFNEYNSQGRCDSEESIYTQTVLKLHGYDIKNCGGVEGFLGDAAKKFWDALVAVFRWFISLFTGNKESKIDETRKSIIDDFNTMNRIDPDAKLMTKACLQVIGEGGKKLISKLSFRNPKNKGPAGPTDFITYMKEEEAALSSELLDSEIEIVRANAYAISGLEHIITKLEKSEYYKLVGSNKTIDAVDLSGTTSSLLALVVELRRECKRIAESAEKNIKKGTGEHLNDPTYKRLCKFIAVVIKQTVKMQNALIKSPIEVIKLLEKMPEFEGCSFKSITDSYEKELIVDEQVKDLV